MAVIEVANKVIPLYSTYPFKCVGETANTIKNTKGPLWSQCLSVLGHCKHGGAPSVHIKGSFRGNKKQFSVLGNYTHKLTDFNATATLINVDQKEDFSTSFEKKKKELDETEWLWFAKMLARYI